MESTNPYDGPRRVMSHKEKSGMLLMVQSEIFLWREI